MLKLDIEKTREAVREAIANYPFDDDPEHREYTDLMRRSADVQSRLTVFAMTEMERDQNEPQQCFISLAAVVGNALFSQMLQVHDENNPDDEKREPTHQMIHIFCDALSAALHSHYYAVTETPADQRHELLHEVPVVRRDVGDA